MRIAFYATLKPPDHPIPSGDRLMANLLIAALTRAGHDVRLASRLRAFSQAADTPALEHLKSQSQSEARALIAEWSSPESPWRPQAWLTYHPYYKAPDWIGPAVCRDLAVPYMTAEASFAGKRAVGPWAASQADVAAAVRQAAINFCLTPVDRDGLERISDRTGILVNLPPFIDTNGLPAGGPSFRDGRPPRLACVAMMRPGDKLASYRMLGAALPALLDLPWTLAVIGDGDQRRSVHDALANVPADRIEWLGECIASDVAAQLAASDIYVWPGTGEAYGLAYLEAQAAGLPVVAQDTGGISAVVRHGLCGLLTPFGDIDAYSAALRGLLANPEQRRRMGAAAHAFVHEERSLAGASAILDRALQGLPQVATVTSRGRAHKAEWQPVHDELERWSAAGRTARLWLRDDDAIDVTPPLERLVGLCEAAHVPMLVATVPAPATDALAAYLEAHAITDGAVHGYAHANHARTGDKSQEFPPYRPLSQIIAEIGAGRQRLAALLGRSLAPIYVPPWNRIAPDVAALLPGLGFRGISTFGTTSLFQGDPPMAEINTHVDIIDWRGTRGGRATDWLASELAKQLAWARNNGWPAIGVLTHHLVHDGPAWTFLERLFEQTSIDPRVQWVRATDLLV
jgi:glycosyltransferase involved in cell wall biosynthesis